MNLPQKPDGRILIIYGNVAEVPSDRVEQNAVNFSVRDDGNFSLIKFKLVFQLDVEFCR